MNNEKGIELIQGLIENRFTYHKIEKDLDIANGSLKKIVTGAIKMSDINYQKLQGYFIKNVLKMEPDVDFASKLSELDSLKERVVVLEAENSTLKTKLSKFQSENKEVTIKPVVTPSVDEVKNNEIILDQIKAIRSETCPKERSTPLGKKAWELEQNKRIQELKNQLK